MGFPIGDSPREREDDLSGLYDGTLIDLQQVDKPEWRIQSEMSNFGKTIDQVDKQELVWTFSFSASDMEDMKGYTGRTWGQKSKAQKWGSALLGETVPYGADSDLLLGRPCRVSVTYSQESGRNRIDDIKPPKVAAKPASKVSKAEMDANDEIPF
jgi:hypothetical protein